MSTHDRRTFLARSAAFSAALWLGNGARGEAKPTDYSGLDSAKYLGEPKVIATVDDETVFTEGPAVAADGTLYFTNVPMSKILKWDPRTSKLSTFAEKTNKTNGLYFEPDGSLLCCEGDTGRLTRRRKLTGTPEVLASEYNGFPLAPPNDVCRDGNGHVYFTSRPSPSDNDPEKGNVNAVYRLDPDGKLVQLLGWPDVHMPNGIVTSPDDRTLYLIEAHPDADRNRNILAFDLSTKGELSNRRVLVDFYPGRSGDGMAVDAKGNLYVAAGLHATRKTSETLDTRPGIHVVSPTGKLLAFARTPKDTVTNCTFGGPDLRTLYVTCGTKIVRIDTTIQGKASYKPKG